MRITTKCPVFKEYQDYKDYCNDIKKYVSLGYITPVYNKLNKDVIEKVVLCVDKVPDIENLLSESDSTFVPRGKKIKNVIDKIKPFSSFNGAAGKYAAKILSNPAEYIESVPYNIKLIKCINAVENNKNTCFIRELSNNVFGDSKVLDDASLLNKAVSLLREYYSISDDNDTAAVLSYFNINKPDEIIRIKGNITIRSQTSVINLADFFSGIAIPFSSINDILSVTINGNKSFTTVENLTTYERCRDNAVMYLGGFASKKQIEFLKKIYAENKNAEYFHFGDIDAGGLYIYKNLIDETGIDFQTLYMNGVLNDPRFSHALKPLTEHDKSRLTNLLECEKTQKIASDILSKNKKLEQEIVGKIFFSDDN